MITSITKRWMKQRIHSQNFMYAAVDALDRISISILHLT